MSSAAALAGLEFRANGFVSGDGNRSVSAGSILALALDRRAGTVRKISLKNCRLREVQLPGVDEEAPSPTSSSLRTPSFVSLATLDLSYNRLTSIPDALFLATPALVALNLSHNALLSLPSSLWLCSKLKRLELQCEESTDAAGATTPTSTTTSSSSISSLSGGLLVGLGRSAGGLIASTPSARSPLASEPAGVEEDGTAPAPQHPHSSHSRRTVLRFFPPPPPSSSSSSLLSSLITGAGAPSPSPAAIVAPSRGKVSPTSSGIGASFARLPELAHVDLRGCGVEVLLPSLGSLSGLTTLKLSHNPLRSLPEVLADMPTLTIVEATHCPLVDVPVSLRGKRNLELITGLPDEVLPGLFLGDATAASNVPALRARGVMRVINVTDTIPAVQADGIDTLVIGVRDVPTENLGFDRVRDPFFFRFVVLSKGERPTEHVLGLDAGAAKGSTVPTVRSSPLIQPQAVSPATRASSSSPSPATSAAAPATEPSPVLLPAAADAASGLLELHRLRAESSDSASGAIELAPTPSSARLPPATAVGEPDPFWSIPPDSASVAVSDPAPPVKILGWTKNPQLLWRRMRRFTKVSAAIGAARSLVQSRTPVASAVPETLVEEQAAQDQSESGASATAPEGIATYHVMRSRRRGGTRSVGGGSVAVSDGSMDVTTTAEDSDEDDISQISSTFATDAAPPSPLGLSGDPSKIRYFGGAAQMPAGSAPMSPAAASSYIITHESTWLPPAVLPALEPAAAATSHSRLRSSSADALATASESADLIDSSDKPSDSVPLRLRAASADERGVLDDGNSSQAPDDPAVSLRSEPRTPLHSDSSLGGEAGHSLSSTDPSIAHLLLQRSTESRGVGHRARRGLDQRSFVRRRSAHSASPEPGAGVDDDSASAGAWATDSSEAWASGTGESDAATASCADSDVAISLSIEASPMPVPVFVHCQAGASRSATVMLALLMRLKGWTLRRAFRHLRAVRPIVSPNLGFWTQLLRFEETLFEAGLLRFSPEDPPSIPTMTLRSLIESDSSSMSRSVWEARYGLEGTAAIVGRPSTPSTESISGSGKGLLIALGSSTGSSRGHGSAVESIAAEDARQAAAPLHAVSYGHSHTSAGSGRAPLLISRGFSAPSSSDIATVTTGPRSTPSSPLAAARPQIGSSGPSPLRPADSASLSSSSGSSNRPAPLLPSRHSSSVESRPGTPIVSSTSGASSSASTRPAPFIPSRRSLLQGESSSPTPLQAEQPADSRPLPFVQRRKPVDPPATLSPSPSPAPPPPPPPLPSTASDEDELCDGFWYAPESLPPFDELVHRQQPSRPSRARRQSGVF